MNISLLLGLLCFALVGILVWVMARARPQTADPALGLMQKQVESLREQVALSLSQNAALLQTQLESVTVNLRSSSGDINQRLDTAAKLYGELRNQLGQLSQTNTQIQSMVKDVATLQDILRPPKLRGGMG